MRGNAMLCFVHIERAGGTTLHYILRNNYLSFLTLTPTRWTNESDGMLTERDLRALLRCLPFTVGFGGHGTRSYLDYERAAGAPVRYVTFLREPVDRYVSHFRYQTRAMGVPWTPGTFLAERRFDNFMTRRIAGSFDVDLAKERLARDFAFVGLSERFDPSLLLMKRVLDLPDLDLRYERQNAGRERPRGERLEDPDFLDAAAERNALDLELYAFARDTIWPRYLERHGTDLEPALGELRAAREGFSFPLLRRLAWKAYRGLVYRNLERAVCGTAR